MRIYKTSLVTLFFSVILGVSGGAVGCGVADIEVKITRAEFVDLCKTRSCPAFRGAAVLQNNCPYPVGVKVKLTAYDASKIPIAVFDGWPASTGDIAPGEYVFSLDTWLDYQQEIAFYKMSVIEVRRWR